MVTHPILLHDHDPGEHKPNVNLLLWNMKSIIVLHIGKAVR